VLVARRQAPCALPETSRGPYGPLKLINLFPPTTGHAVFFKTGHRNFRFGGKTMPMPQKGSSAGLEPHSRLAPLAVTQSSHGFSVETLFVGKNFRLSHRLNLQTQPPQKTHSSISILFLPLSAPSFSIRKFGLRRLNLGLGRLGFRDVVSPCQHFHIQSLCVFQSLFLAVSHSCSLSLALSLPLGLKTSLALSTTHASCADSA